MAKKSKKTASEKRTKLEINKNGELVFPDISFILFPKDISPDDCHAALREYKSDNDWNVDTGFLWKYYYILFEGMPGTVNLCFYGDKLNLIQIGVNLPSEELIEGWPTEKSSKEEIDFIKKTFKKQFGGKLKYGTPYHYFDPRSYCAQCGIDYDI